MTAASERLGLEILALRRQRVAWKVIAWRKGVSITRAKELVCEALGMCSKCRRPLQKNRQ